MHDYHVHSNYSDGRFLPRMLAAAEDAGLDGIGFADHCNVSDRDAPAAFKRQFGFNLDLTYERRREAIESLRESASLRIYDAVEMDYHPRDEAAIREFLDATDFDYAIGSVHGIEGHNVHDEAYFGSKSRAGLEVVVDTYVEHLVALLESELFEIAAHLDLPQRNDALRGLFTEDHYHRIAEALADSRTVPELNAGRITGDYGQFHPDPAFREVLEDYGVEFTVGSDAHTPEDLQDNLDALRGGFDRSELDPIVLDV